MAMITLISVDAMKKSMYLLFAIAAMASVACEHTEELAPEAPATGLVQRDFTALVTKTALSGSDVFWQEGDEISVFADGTANDAGGAKYALKDYDSDNPSSKATFTGTVADAPSYYAVYPYSATNAYDGNATLTATIPAEQVITSGSFAPGAAVVVSKATENYQFLFQNAVALLKVTIADSMSGATKIEISGNNGEIIAGAFTATYGKSGFTFADAASGTSTTASLVYEGGNFVGGGQSYYIAIRPCTFSKGLTAKAYFGEGNSNIAVKTSSAQVTVAAGQILTLGTFDADSWAPTLELGDFETLTLGSGTYLTFDYGQSETFPVNLASGVNTSALQDDGWTVSYSDGSVTITAPANNGSHAPQPGAIVLTSTQNSSVTTSYGLRLRGIGSVEELQSFNVAQGIFNANNAAVPSPDLAKCAPYLVENDSAIKEILLTADLAFESSDLFHDNDGNATHTASGINNYALNHNEFPLNGNNRTVRFNDVVTTDWSAGFIRFMRRDVHDLTLRGSWRMNRNSPASMGALASEIKLTETGDPSILTVDKVNSYVDLTYNGNSQTTTRIGGLIGYLRTGNKGILIKDSRVEADIDVIGELHFLGGILANGERTGTGGSEIKTTLQNCSYKGNISYTPQKTSNTDTADRHIGGLIGCVEHTLELFDCTVAGTITLNMANWLYNPGRNAKQTVGGFIGYMPAAASGTSTGNTVTNSSAASMQMIVEDANTNEYSTAFQGYSYNLSGGTGGANNHWTNKTNAPAAVFHYYSAPEISSAATKSFAYGVTQEVPVTTGDLTDWTVTPTAPEGWTVNVEHIKDASPYITVTSPSQDAIKAGTASGMGSVTFTLTSTANGSAPASGDGVAVRLYGINSLEELKAFRTEHGVTVNSESDVDKTKLTPWLRNGNEDEVLLLNTDIALDKSDLTSAAFIMRSCFVPIEGNNRTITFNNISTAATRMSLFQALYYDVSNLNIAGRMAIEKSAETDDTEAWIASLSTVLSGNATISNVNSSVAMAVKKGTNASYTKVIAGGIVGKIQTVDGVTASGATFTNCNFTGSITMDRTSQYVGGILGTVLTASNAPITVYFNDCDCSADITANRTASYLGGIVGSGGSGSSGSGSSAVSSTVILTDCDYTGTITSIFSYTSVTLRIGGILGDCQRRAELTNCTISDGSINVDTNGQLFNTNASRAIGGIIGRRGAQVTNHDMTTLITDCTMAVPINITNAHASEAETVNGETDASKQGISVVVGNNRAPANSSLAVGTLGRFFDNTKVTGSVIITKAQ